MNRELKVKCGKHKCELVVERTTYGNHEEEDYVCLECIKEYNETQSLKTDFDYVNKE